MIVQVDVHRSPARSGLHLREERAGVSGQIGVQPPMAESAGVALPLPPAWDHVVHDTWPDDTVLPWDHLRTTLKKETLQHHRMENLRSE